MIFKKKKNKGITLSKISSQSNFFAVRGRGENIYIIIITITFIIYFPGEKLNTFETKII